MSDAKKVAQRPSPNLLPRDPLTGLATILKQRIGGGVQPTGAGGGGDSSKALGVRSSGGTVALRVLRRGAKPHKLEAGEVHLPMDDVLARTVIRADEKDNEERVRLKHRILTMAS